MPLSVKSKPSCLGNHLTHPFCRYANGVAKAAQTFAGLKTLKRLHVHIWSPFNARLAGLLRHLCAAILARLGILFCGMAMSIAINAAAPVPKLGSDVSFRVHSGIVYKNKPAEAGWFVKARS